MYQQLHSQLQWPCLCKQHTSGKMLLVCSVRTANKGLSLKQIILQELWHGWPGELYAVPGKLKYFYLKFIMQLNFPVEKLKRCLKVLLLQFWNHESLEIRQQLNPKCFHFMLQTIQILKKTRRDFTSTISLHNINYIKFYVCISLIILIVHTYKRKTTFKVSKKSISYINSCIQAF